MAGLLLLPLLHSGERQPQQADLSPLAALSWERQRARHVHVTHRRPLLLACRSPPPSAASLCSSFLTNICISHKQMLMGSISDWELKFDWLADHAGLTVEDVAGGQKAVVVLSRHGRSIVLGCNIAQWWLAAHACVAAARCSYLLSRQHACTHPLQRHASCPLLPAWEGLLPFSPTHPTLSPCRCAALPSLMHRSLVDTIGPRVGFLMSKGYRLSLPSHVGACLVLGPIACRCAHDEYLGAAALEGNAAFPAAAPGQLMLHCVLASISCRMDLALTPVHSPLCINHPPLHCPVCRPRMERRGRMTHSSH